MHVCTYGCMYVCINIWTDVCSNAPCSSILSCTMSYWTLLFQSYCGHTSCVHITDIRTHIHIHIYIYAYYTLPDQISLVTSPWHYTVTTSFYSILGKRRFTDPYCISWLSGSRKGLLWQGIPRKKHRGHCAVRVWDFRALFFAVDRDCI